MWMRTSQPEILSGVPEIVKLGCFKIAIRLTLSYIKNESWKSTDHLRGLNP